MALEFYNISIVWADLFDILLVTGIIYRFLHITRGTRIVSALYGTIVLLIAYVASDKLGFHTLNWLLNYFLSSFFIVTVIIFQKDIRVALLDIGTHNIFKFLFYKSKTKLTFTEQIVNAATKMAKQRIGALIVLEKKVPLDEMLTKGVILNADISSDLLQAIFYPKNPLHDGAVIIRGNKILAAGCILPLSNSGPGKRDFGTRHRAALGATEESDSIVIVVSEERGEISIAHQGKLIPVPDLGRFKVLFETLMESK